MKGLSYINIIIIIINDGILDVCINSDLSYCLTIWLASTCPKSRLNSYAWAEIALCFSELLTNLLFICKLVRQERTTQNMITGNSKKY